MNINQLKAFLGGKPPHLGNESSVQNQLRDAGLQQAASLQADQSQSKTDQFSSSTTFGVRVYASALSSSIEINSKRPDFSMGKAAKVAKPAFDFEEVAKNVLKFVGAALKGAKQNGADDAELSKLFEQASSGVLKGIKLAEKDLAGFMNDEIRNGIDESKKLIEGGVQKLKQDLLENKPAKEPETATNSVQSVSITNVAVEQQQSGELYIKTKDGDEVRLSFEDVRQFELNQQIVVQNSVATTEPEVPDKQLKADSSNKSNGEESELVPVKTAVDSVNEVAAEESAEKQDINLSGNTNIQAVEQKSIYHQSNSLSFSVSGELDDEELKAIGQLVADANDLADEFFNGDIQEAYNQALKIGFDDQELVGFALQLNKVENTQVIKAYETISHFDKDNQDSESVKAAKPVAHYLDKMLGVVQESKLKLEDGQSYENLINGLINRMGEVHTPDLIHAINRFHTFNQKLVDNLPLTFKDNETAKV